MPARHSRQEARERILKAFAAELDRIIPADGRKPLKGARFLEWELQVQRLKRNVMPILLEERAALEDNAQVTEGGHCPHCGSNSVYLEKQTTPTEVHSPDGPAIIERQHCRCRTCDGSFSPSES